MSSSSVYQLPKISAMDQLAHAALLPTAWARYVAYRNALIADGLDSERIVGTLSLFLADLAAGRAANGVH